MTPWYSTADSADVLATRNGGDLRCYLRVGDEVFQTYETKWRGSEAMLPTCLFFQLVLKQAFTAKFGITGGW